MESDAIWRTHYVHPGQWDREFSLMTLPEMLLQATAANPQAPLLDFYGRTYTYAEVCDGARRVAKGLKALGIQKGDRVGLFLPNVPHYVAAYFGAAMAGAVLVNFSPLYSPEELEHQVEDSGTRLLITVSAKQLLPTALEVLDNSSLERLVVGSIAGGLSPTKSVLYRLFKSDETAHRPHDDRLTRFSELIDNDGIADPDDVSPHEVALLQYTGGTTGRPKGAMLTHQNLTANARQTDAMNPWQPDEPDRIIGVLPFFHVFANTAVMNRTISRGGQIIMLPRFEAGQVLEAVQRTKATALPGVPTMFQALLDHPDLAKTDFSTVRFCISGGAPMPSEVQAKFEAATGARLIEGYGLTESSGVISCNPYEGEARPGTIGQPVAGTRIRLADKEDAHKPAPDGEPGELLFKGPQAMKGYWNRPDADEDSFVDGWVRTGDVATIDEDGFIRIVDRLKDMIAVGGFKVFPSQIEAVLYHHPAIREALVIGIPDSYRGEMPKAFVTIDEDAKIDGEALKEWLNPQLGKHERVIEVEIRDSLPKTMVGKLSRKELVAEERAKAATA